MAKSVKSILDKTSVKTLNSLLDIARSFAIPTATTDVADETPENANGEDK